MKQCVYMYLPQGDSLVLQTGESLGGKAYNLAILSEQQFAIPKWFCLSTQVFSSFLSDHPKIQHQLSSLDVESAQVEIKQASIAIEQIIMDWELPDAVVSELFTTFDSQFEPHAKVAVRSSVVGEDSKMNSFAGQMDSFLNVSRRQLNDRIKACVCSAYTSRALTYRLHKKLDLKSIRAAVIVQEMVASKSAGVLFTRNPHAKETDKTVISAAFGLGEGVVADRAESDTYYVDNSSLQVDSHVNTKMDYVVSAPQGGTVIKTVSKNKRDVPVLSSAQIIELYQLGQQVEEIYGVPQDIEWAYDKKGNYYLLQSRPVTMGSPARLSLWDNSNIVESYPGLSTPLTFSFVRHVYEEVFSETLRGFGAHPQFLSDNSSALSHMVGYLKGRIYYNLINWYSFVSVLQGGKGNIEQMEMMIGVKKSIHDEQELRASLKSFDSNLLLSMRLYLCTLTTFISLNKNISRYLSDAQEFLGGLNKRDFSELNGHELMDIYYQFEARFLRRAALTNYNDFFTMKFYGKLKESVSKWGPQEHSNLHNDLLCGETGVESVEPVKSIIALAQHINSHREAKQLFEEEPDPLNIWHRLQTQQMYKELWGLIEEHLRKYGDRSLQELKLETPHLRDNPIFFITLLRDQLRTNRSIEVMESNEKRIRHNAERILWSHLRWHPLRKAVLKVLLSRTRRHVKQRENLRFARSRLFGMTKKIFRSSGELLAHEGALGNAEDIFYLEMGEVFNFIRGTSTLTDLKLLVRQRREQFKEWQDVELPQRVVTKNSVYGNLDTALHEYQDDPATAVVVDGDVQRIQGLGCSVGKVRAKARIIHDPYNAAGIQGEILVTKMTDPGWVFLMLSSGGIVVEKGSLLSHTAIIGRELGIPTVVGATGATQLIKEGQLIEIDGQKGEVTLL